MSNKLKLHFLQSLTYEYFPLFSKADTLARIGVFKW
jgi:hypothetical protein